MPAAANLSQLITLWLDYKIKGLVLARQSEFMFTFENSLILSWVLSDSYILYFVLVPNITYGQWIYTQDFDAEKNILSIGNNATSNETNDTF